MSHLNLIHTACLFISCAVFLFAHTETEGMTTGEVIFYNSATNNVVFSCSDGIQNGDETGVDCGGTVCPPCNGNGNCGSAATFPQLSTEMVCDPNLGTVLNFYYQGGGLGGYQYSVEIDGLTNQFTLSYPLPNVGDQIFGRVLGYDAPYGTPGYSFDVSINGCDPNIILYTETVQSIMCTSPCTGSGPCGDASGFPLISTAMVCDPNFGTVLNFYYDGLGQSDNQYTVDIDGQLNQFTVPCPLPNIGDQLFGVILGLDAPYGTPGYSFDVSIIGCDPNTILYTETVQSIVCTSPCTGSGPCGDASGFPLISTAMVCDPNFGTVLNFYYEGLGQSDNQYTVDIDGQLNQFTVPCPLPNIGDQLFGRILGYGSPYGIQGYSFDVSIVGCDPNTILYTETIQSIDCQNCSDPMDYVALRALYLSTDGDNWTDNTGWPNTNFFTANPTIPTGVNLSSWNGVVCEDDKVRHLELPNNNLVGTIPIEIGLFSDNLHTLNLGDNSLTGTIPSELWDLTSLYFLNLENGSLTGQLPSEIGNLSNLDVLLLNSNNLSGPLPLEMKELSNMHWISLSFNSFSGTIDHDFFEKWTTIHDIRFDHNQFSGDLPNSLGDRTSLRVALLNNNQFTGCFPYNYKNLCTNRDYVTHSGFNFGGNVGLGVNDGDFDAFCDSDAGLCATTIDCHWVELTINTGTGPLFFKYNIRPFDYDCNGGTIHSGEYFLDTDAPNTTLTYVHELDENWFQVFISNSEYDGSDLSQTIEIKEHSTGNIIMPEEPIEYGNPSDYFPICSAVAVNQNLTVTNNNDSGPGSLRQAIIDSNCTFGKDDISILTTGTINLTSCDLNVNNGADCFIILPPIRDEVCIYGNGIKLTTNTTGRLISNNSNLTMKDLTIDNINYSTFQGGTGGAIWAGFSLSLENVTISNCFASGDGGAIMSYGDVDIKNCTFSNNSSGRQGGAIVSRVGSCTIDHSTFTGNSSSEGGAIYTWTGTEVNLSNSIFANSQSDADLHLNSTLTSNNTNLVETCVGNCPAFDIMANPQLDPLQDNGGVTFTHALQAGSPAIDAVNPGTLLLDQRGYEVFNGEKDLGAYEFGGVDADGCDLVEFEGIDIMGNSEESTAHLMVGGNNTIDMNADVLYQAGQLIDLKPGFEVVQGSVFEALIGPCIDPDPFYTPFNPVTSPATGRIWMDRNLGATQVATSSTDASSYGYLFQWGRDADGHQLRTSNTTTVLATTDDPGHPDFILGQGVPNEWRLPANPNLWQGLNGINNPCPNDYRIPTEAELDAERQSWSSNDAAGAIASPLKLPLTGFRFGSDGGMNVEGIIGYYWSSSLSTDNTYPNKYLWIGNNNALVHIGSASTGFAVRCIKD